MITVNVEPGDIKNGKMGNPWFCPIGLALARAVGHDDVAVRRHYIRIRKDMYQMPVNIKAAIAIYDRTGEMTPVSFELNENEKTDRN